ncbi:MAG: MHYT domain-containing protein [Gemmobacter sp.]
MVEAAHDWRLVLASLAVAMMAGFTGLSLTQGAGRLDAGPRKAVVSMAAVALGGGVWSMHFVAMLGLNLPFAFSYDPLVTLISALASILITGVALLILHFLPRSPRTITTAGVIIGIGIPIMHYIGMSGMQLCRPVYTVWGVGLALAASIALSVAAVRLAYSERGRRNILLGTMGFGLAVFSVHFIAMAGTGFLADATAAAGGPLLRNETLAMIVTLSAFVISSAFLLTGITFAPAAPPIAAPPVAPPFAETPAPPPRPAPDAAPPRIPYEREGRTLFLDTARLAAVEAEGHYTLLHAVEGRLFCPWSISEAEARLLPVGFLRVHRGWLVNPRLVTGFERRKDGGFCLFAPGPRVPVARSRLPEVRQALGL